MTQKSVNLTKSFWTWVIGSILGISAAVGIILVVPTIQMVRQSDALALLLVTLPLGLAQWLVLRRFFPTSILWIFTLTVGLLLYFRINQAIPQEFWQRVDDESIVVLTAAYLLIGFLVGFLQWLILRRQAAHSALWILASAVGIALGFWLAFATDLMNQSPLVAYILIVVIYAAATGAALVRMLAGTAQPGPELARPV